jgi:hypothetical protein
MFPPFQMGIFVTFDHKHVSSFSDGYICYIWSQTCFLLFRWVYLLHLFTNMFPPFQMGLFVTFDHKHVSSFSDGYICYIWSQTCFLLFRWVYLLHLITNMFPPFQMGIFGRCPVDYNVHDHAPHIIFTRHNLTLCKMPHIFTLQMRLFSIIKKIHGGYRETEILEVLITVLIHCITPAC